MKKINYSIKPGMIKGSWIASGSTFKCSFEPKTDGDGSSSFELTLMGSGIRKGELEMIGAFERDEFIETLEVILRELKK